MNEDLVGLIVRSSTEALLWWTVRLSRLTEIDPSIRCDALHVHIYTETRAGKRKMRSIAVDRLHGHLVLDKLPSGSRVSAALGVQVVDGFTHVESCPPIHMPSKTTGSRSLGQRRWVGAPQLSTPGPSRALPNLDGSRGLPGMSEHLPWEHQR